MTIGQEHVYIAALVSAVTSVATTWATMRVLIGRGAVVFVGVPGGANAPNVVVEDAAPVGEILGGADGGILGGPPAGLGMLLEFNLDNIAEFNLDNIAMQNGIPANDNPAVANGNVEGFIIPFDETGGGYFADFNIQYGADLYWEDEEGGSN